MSPSNPQDWLRPNYPRLSRFKDRNITFEVAFREMFPTLSGGFFVDELPESSPNFVFASLFEKKVSLTICQADLEQVRCRVGCKSTFEGDRHCAVEKMRPASAQVRAADMKRRWMKSLQAFPSALNDSLLGAGTTRTEEFLWDPVSYPNPSPTKPRLDLMNIMEFEARFAQLLNTYYAVSICPNDMLFGAPSRRSFTCFDNAVAAGTKIMLQRPAYHISRAWMTIYFIGNTIMFLATFATIFFRFASNGPELLGYVSSIFNASPHFSYLKTNSTLTGPKRAVEMKEVRVAVIDMCADQDVGKIAFAHPDMGRRIERLRFYA
jgi:hypothetical protein